MYSANEKLLNKNFLTQYLYNYSEKLGLQADEMIANLRASFKALLGELDWMDEATKAVARDKVRVEQIACLRGDFSHIF